MNTKNQYIVGNSFLDWMLENDLFYNRFLKLADLLDKFIIEVILEDRNLKELKENSKNSKFEGLFDEIDEKENARAVASSFLDVIENCDKISFNEKGVPEAYAALHFLDRYHRFQLIFQELINNNLMPIKDYPLDCLDIGNGPGPAAYAISDMYNFINEYGKAHQNDKLNTQELIIDYVERSYGFRNWLHHFTEYVNSNDQQGWNVPYHHGSYFDFKNLNFQTIKTNYREDLIDKYESEGLDGAYFVDHVDSDWKNLFRYNIIMFSNFLTSPQQVDDFRDELISCVNALRNYGLLIIIGARGKQYPEIYFKINELLTKRKYIKNKSISYLDEYQFSTNQMSYHGGDRFGERIRNSYKKILSKIEDLDLTASVPKKALNMINSYILNPSKQKWEIHVLKKISKVKRKK